MAKGDITHVEFPADDIERAKRFYSAVAGWEFTEMEASPGYWLFGQEGDRSGGGLGMRGESVADEIRIYVSVPSLEVAVAAAKDNGGSLVTDPSEVPGYGRWASVRDSEGSTIGLFESART